MRAPFFLYYPIKPFVVFGVVFVTFLISLVLGCLLYYALVEHLKNGQDRLNRFKKLPNKLWQSFMNTSPTIPVVTTPLRILGRLIWFVPAIRALQLGYEAFIVQNEVTYLRSFGLLGELIFFIIFGTLLMATPEWLITSYKIRWTKKMDERIKNEVKRLRREYNSGNVSISDLYLLEVFHYGKANISSFSDFKKLIDQATTPKGRWDLFNSFFSGPTTFFDQYKIKTPPGVLPADFDSLQNENFFWFWENAIDSFLKAHRNIADEDCRESLNNLKESWRHLIRGLKHLRSGLENRDGHNEELINIYRKLRNRLSREAGWSVQKIEVDFG